MSPDHARPAKPDGWTGWQRFLAVLLVLLGLGITVPAFVEIYLTITHLVRPAFGAWAWTVPASGEIAFTFLFLNGVLLAMRRAPGGALRAALMAALMAGSVVLNVWAARDNLPSAVGHVLIVAAFFGVLLAGKATVMTLRGGKVRADRITAGEWVAQPLRSLSLWRWMKTWGEPSRDAALERYMRLMFAFTIAKADDRVGRRPFCWRRKLPDILRYQFATGTLPEASGESWMEAIEGHVRGQLSHLDARQPEGTAGVTSQGTTGGSTQVTQQGTRQGKPRGTDWPESRTVDRAVLVRRTRTAMKRWEDRHDGKRLPATQLGTQLRLRMSRDTATALLAEAASASGPHLVKTVVR
jgi:hypothetical protein